MARGGRDEGPSPIPDPRRCLLVVLLVPWLLVNPLGTDNQCFSSERMKRRYAIHDLILSQPVVHRLWEKAGGKRIPCMGIVEDVQPFRPTLCITWTIHVVMIG